MRYIVCRKLAIAQILRADACKLAPTARVLRRPYSEGSRRLSGASTAVTCVWVAA